MAASPLCAVLLILSVWGASHGGDAVSPPKPAVPSRPAPNVALTGIATQSSTHSYFGSARNANDGSLAANYLRSQCSHTKNESDPWWMVNLKAPYKVMSVAVTNRVLECCRERIFGAEIRVGNDGKDGGKANPRCGVISSIESGETVSFSCHGMVGKHVSVVIPGRSEHMVLCEVQVFGLPADDPAEVTVPTSLKTSNGAPNVARHGVARQSSLYNMYGEAKNAIDGSLDSNYLYIQCAGTAEQKDPWWMVDLKAKHKVDSVAVTNRGDCCGSRINGAEIKVGNSEENGGIDNPVCGVITSMYEGQTLSFECGGMEGQYVTVTIPGEKRTLTISEVQVFGLPSDDHGDDQTSVDGGDDSGLDLPSLDDIFGFIWGLTDEDDEKKEEQEYDGDDLAFRGITSQSSTYDKFGSSENAIDGYTSTTYMAGHCSHTDLDVEPWWRVDLLNVYNITKVKIRNRGDCCHERINEAEIRIGNSPENGGTRNPRCTKIESLGLGKEEEYECNMVGRYVTVTIPDRAGYLTLCGVKVYGTFISIEYPVPPVHPESYDSQEHAYAKELRNVLKHSNAAPNVAMTATTSQSSTDGGSSNSAIDGEPKTCTKTQVEKSPWWTLDLGADHKVFFIAVTSPDGSSAQDLHAAEIHVGTSATGWKKNPICGTLSSIGPGETYSFNCNELEGRYVTISVPDKETALSICEVQVFALSVDTPSGDWNGDAEVQRNHHGVKNLAPQGVPSQSSYYGEQSEARAAIDGSLASNYLAGECTHTRRQNSPWWSIDLQSSYSISSVAITNRGDCCRERINGAEIRIGDSAEDGGIKNPRCAVVFKMNYGETMSFNCKGMEGRYVTVVIPEQRQYLSVCEVQIFGKSVEISQQVVTDETKPTKPTQPPTSPPALTNLEGKAFYFPQESATDYVELSPAQPMRLSSFTLCMKLSMNVSDNRETILFSYRTLYYDELNLWLEANGDVGLYMSGEGMMYPVLDHSKEWNHLCLTWESKNGRSELWVNGRRRANRVYRPKHTVQPGGIAILGQDQDELGKGFDKSQSYIGKIKDLNMWNKVLSLKSLRSVFKDKGTRKGEVFDWSNLSYTLHGKVEVV